MFTLTITFENGDQMQMLTDQTSRGILVLQDMPPIRAGADAFHFQVPSMDSLQRTFLNHDQISEIKGASIMDGGVLKPVDMWISDSSRLSSISTTKKYISSLSIDVQVFDLGQNTAGLCRCVMEKFLLHPRLQLGKNGLPLLIFFE